MNSLKKNKAKYLGAAAITIASKLGKQALTPPKVKSEGSTNLNKTDAPEYSDSENKISKKFGKLDKI